MAKAVRPFEAVVEGINPGSLTFLKLTVLAPVVVASLTNSGIEQEIVSAATKLAPK